MPLPRIDPALYHVQLDEKLSRFREDFADFALPPPTVFPSPPLHYRLRAEFRIYHSGTAGDDQDGSGRIDYAMFAPEAPKRPVVIEQFPAADAAICALMPRLLARLQGRQNLTTRLFQINFLATLSGEMLVTLIYHRALDEAWEAEAREVAEEFQLQLIGRSLKQKIVIGRDWLLEEFHLNGRHLRYQQREGSFTQPNGHMNSHMLEWACQQVADHGGDLLELYCGNGNFTMALAPYFDRVLATEVSKSSVQAAEYNRAANGISNLELVRMASDEISAALARVRNFERLKHVDLDAYRFSTLFVDPPRSGLDATTLELARGFERVLYISCNPQTLKENVAALQPSHQIRAAAVFDQFPYTHHLECGLLLERRTVCN